MWIISQDKKSLTKAINIALDIPLSSGETGVKGYFNNNKFEILGYYKSEERALEVLDEIQKKINDIKKDFLMACMREKGVYDVIAWNDFVYQMPEE